MKPYYRLLFLGCLCCALLLAALPSYAAADPAGSWVPTRPDTDANTRKGFEHFYELDYDKAIHDFEAAQAAHPDDPFAVNHTLAAVTFKELSRIGALDTEAYAGDTFMNKKAAVPLDPAVRDRIRQLTAQSLALSQARLDKNPDDVNALYARGATRALESTYIGLGEKAWFSALRMAVTSRHDSERVLELDPTYVDAKVGIGTDLYIVGSLSWPAKVAASVVGFSGNKQKGLDYLRQATASNHVEVATDAKIMLALFLRREQKYAEVLQLVNSMTNEYPRNFIMAAEYAHLLNAAGHGQEAIAAYRKVLAGCRSNVYNQCRIAIPAFGLGESLRGQKEYAAAAEAYELAAGSAKDDPNLQQRATLAAGEMYDVLHKRDTALEKYQAVIAENSTSNSADLARHYLKQAYTTP
jgi:tetratricopeptide (TPR) repeat protein